MLEYLKTRRGVVKGRRKFKDNKSSISEIIYHQSNDDCNRFFKRTRLYLDAKSNQHIHLNRKVRKCYNSSDPRTRTDLRYLYDDRDGSHLKKYNKSLTRPHKTLMRIFTESPEDEYTGTKDVKNFSLDNVVPFEGRLRRRTKQVSRYQRKMKSRTLKPPRRQIMVVPRRYEVSKREVREGKVNYRNMLNYQIRIKTTGCHNRMKILDD